jgi:hypothetical protein
MAGYARHSRALARDPGVQAALLEQLSGQNCFFGEDSSRPGILWSLRNGRRQGWAAL